MNANDKSSQRMKNRGVQFHDKESCNTPAANTHRREALKAFPRVGTKAIMFNLNTAARHRTGCA